MNGYPNIRKGWWQRENQWSWSWAVAHSFYWYLSGATTGLRAEAVERPKNLFLEMSLLMISRMTEDGIIRRL